MKLEEAIKSGREFKRKHWGNWMKSDGNWLVWTTGRRASANVINAGGSLIVSDILADDYEIKEKWYEGDFKSKYPNGVLCAVRNYCDANWERAIVTNYTPEINSDYPFVTACGTWSNVMTLPLEDLPSIIKKEG